MEIILFVLFAWFLFILGRYFKDFAITAISGLLITIVGVLSWPQTQQAIPEFIFALVNLCLGIYILFRSIIEILNVYFKDFYLKKLEVKNAIKTIKNKRGN